MFLIFCLKNCCQSHLFEISKTNNIHTWFTFRVVYLTSTQFPANITYTRCGETTKQDDDGQDGDHHQQGGQPLVGHAGTSVRCWSARGWTHLLKNPINTFKHYANNDRLQTQTIITWVAHRYHTNIDVVNKRRTAKNKMFPVCVFIVFRWY